MLTLYHSPKSRSTRIIWLLEELAADYRLRFVTIRHQGSTESPDEDYRKIHPHLKVPALVHDDVVVTESPAICAYLADAFPQAGLAPPIGDPRRGPYLSWLVHCSTVVDPGLTARANGWPTNPFGVGFGVFEEMEARLNTGLPSQGWLLGADFTAADVMVCSVVRIGRASGVLPDRPVYRDYLARATSRAAFQRAMTKDQDA